MRAIFVGLSNGERSFLRRRLRNPAYRIAEVRDHLTRPHGIVELDALENATSISWYFLNVFAFA